MSQQVLETSIPRILDCFNRGVSDYPFHVSMFWYKAIDFCQGDSTSHLQDVFGHGVEYCKHLNGAAKPQQLLYIYSKFQNDLTCIGAVMDDNVKQCTDFAMYFYQIRWFDITAFASKAQTVQDVVEITPPPPSSFVCRLQIL